MDILTYLAKNPLAFYSIVAVLSFIIMVKSADMLVFGITRYAKRTGLSDYLIGLLVVSITASVPELVSSIAGIFEGDPGIIFGTILGSNLTGITLVLGIFALVGRKLKLINKVLAHMEVALFFLIMLPFVLGADGSLSGADGIILVAAYIGYAVHIWVKESKTGHMKKNVKFRFLWKNAVIFLLALAALLLSSRFLVHSSIVISKTLGIPTYIAAILIIGIAASLPDLLVGIRSIFEGETGVGIGDAIGSIIVKALLFLGIFAIIKPLPVDINMIIAAMLTTIFALAVVMYLTERKRMDWRHGLLLVFIYLAYISIELIKELVT